MKGEGEKEEKLCWEWRRGRETNSGGRCNKEKEEGGGGKEEGGGGERGSKKRKVSKVEAVCRWS